MKFDVKENGWVSVDTESTDKFKLTNALTAAPRITEVDGYEALNFGRTDIIIEGKKKPVYLIVRLDRHPELRVAIEAGQKIIADAKARDEAEEKAVADACPTGFEPCKRNWANGDLCSAEYEAADGTTVLDSDLIEGKLGVYYIKSEKLEEKRAKNKAAAEKAAVEKAEKEAAEKAIFEKAAETGEPQRLDSWVKYEWIRGEGECSVVYTKLALPDGETKIRKTNTY